MHFQSCFKNSKWVSTSYQYDVIAGQQTLKGGNLKLRHYEGSAFKCRERRWSGYLCQYRVGTLFICVLFSHWKDLWTELPRCRSSSSSIPWRYCSGNFGPFKVSRLDFLLRLGLEELSIYNGGLFNLQNWLCPRQTAAISETFTSTLIVLVSECPGEEHGKTGSYCLVLDKYTFWTCRLVETTYRRTEESSKTTLQSPAMLSF